MKRTLVVALVLVMAFGAVASAGPFASGFFENGLIDLSVGVAFAPVTIEATISDIATQTGSLALGPQVDVSFAVLIEKENVDGEIGVDFVFEPFVVYPFTFVLDEIVLFGEVTINLADLFETSWTFDVFASAELALDDTFVSAFTYRAGFYLEMPWLPKPVAVVE